MSCLRPAWAGRTDDGIPLVRLELPLRRIDLNANPLFQLPTQGRARLLPVHDGTTATPRDTPSTSLGTIRNLLGTPRNLFGNSALRRTHQNTPEHARTHQNTPERLRTFQDTLARRA